jgi:hypothetical protein
MIGFISFIFRNKEQVFTSITGKRLSSTEMRLAVQPPTSCVLSSTLATATAVKSLFT